MDDDVAAAPVSLIVPAHNEAAVIRRCLAQVLRDAYDGEFTTIVVSNGSTDRTVDVAHEAARGRSDVLILELADASKTAALRAGLERADHGAVVVVDADVEIATSALRALADAIRVKGPVVAAARPRVETGGTSWAIRRYYRVWTAQRYAAGGPVGSGVFALSEAGVRQLGVFPDVTNDDAWVRRSFRPEQRVVVDAEYVVHAARTARALVARRARVTNGNRALGDSLGPDPDGGTLTDLAGGLRLGRYSALDVVVFLGITVLARSAALMRRLRHDERWSTDSSSRVPS